MPDDKKNDCLNQSDTCKVCFEKNFNVKNNIQKCFVSDGQPIESTLSNNSSMQLATKTCKYYNDMCFSLISSNGLMIKDCLKEYSLQNNLPISFFYEQRNSSMYNMCSSSLCNDHKMKSLFCLSCDSRSGQNCSGLNGESIREMCPLEITSSGCYHYHNDYIRRGCVANLNAKHRELCTSNSDVCKICTGDNCNNRPSFQKCLSNDGLDDIQNKFKICKLYSDDCFVHLSNNTIYRGCTSDLMELVANVFIQNENLKICTKMDNCNNDQIEYENCIVCSGESDCAIQPNIKMMQKCPLALNKMGCYSYIDQKNYVERGCLSHLKRIDQDFCENSNGICQKCSGDNCNIKSYFKCYACNSIIDGEYCINSSKLTYKNICNSHTGHCYTQVRDGVVERGCVGDEIVPNENICSKNPDTCESCSDDICNKEPIKPTICFACNSTIDKTCANYPSFSMSVECPITSIHPQKCYHFINKTSGEHIRGKTLIP